MARRRKKSKAAAQSRSKEKDAMLVDKSLPALPPNAIPQSAFSPDRETLGSNDTDTPTELSPRPRTNHPHDSSSRSSSRRTRSPDRSIAETTHTDGLLLPSTTYRNKAQAEPSQKEDASDDTGEFFIPMALDTNPPSTTPRSADTWNDAKSKNKENRTAEKDYFAMTKSSGRPQTEKSSKYLAQEQAPDSQATTPHIASQEKGRHLSSDFTEGVSLKDSSRKATTLEKSGSSSAGLDKGRSHNASTHRSAVSNGNVQAPPEKFRLQEVPKGKKSMSRSTSQADVNNDAIPASEKIPKSASGIPTYPPRKESHTSTKNPESPQRQQGTEKSQDSRSRNNTDPRPSIESSSSTHDIPERVDSKSAISRKEVPASKMASSTSVSSGQDASSRSPSPTDDAASTPTVNGKAISGPLVHSPTSDELVPPSRASGRPAPQQQISDSYMVPRAPPPPPAMASHRSNQDSVGSIQLDRNGLPISPKLPRWSGGGDFTMDEDMARILGTDGGSQTLLRRVSNAVRHGRNNSESSIHRSHGRSISETTRMTTSPRWQNVPIMEDLHGIQPRDISSPISISSPIHHEDSAVIRRQLRNSQQRVAELERHASVAGDLKNLSKRVLEKRKTVSVLDSQAEIMIRQIEVLAGYVEKAKDTKQPFDASKLEESAVKEFVQKLEKLKQTMSSAVEQLYEERNELLEEKTQAIIDRDRALQEFEQLSSKNAQLVDMNNEITHQIQERFKAQSGSSIEVPKAGLNGLGIYTHHTKGKSNSSIHLEDLTVRSTTGSSTAVASVGSYPQSMEQEPGMEPATILAAPHVVNIRKGQVKKTFNWKKSGQTVGKGVIKGFKGALASVGQQDHQQWQGQSGDNIGMPYNMTMAPMESPNNLSAPQPGSLPRSVSNDPSRQGFGLFKKSNTMPKAMSSMNVAAPAAEHAEVLFGSELVDRADYERRQIPSVVTRCIEEVELRGMDVQGIYRKTGGSGQQKVVQEGFERMEDFDISDPDLDITAVTSVLKQYFRRLPTPLLTFDVYDRILESNRTYFMLIFPTRMNANRCQMLRMT